MLIRKIFTIVLFLMLGTCHAHHACYAKDASFKVLASTFPIYIFTANVCANIENVQTELLVPAQAGCPHDFALKPGDLLKLSKTNVLIINGAGLEEFLGKILNNLEKPVPVIDASKGITLLPVSSAVEHDGHRHQHSWNPHTFASPFTAVAMVNNISTELARLDPANAESYGKNAAAYVERLNKISASMEQTGKNAANKKIALEHDALAYLAKNANLEVVTIFENNDSGSRLAQLKKLLLREEPALLAGDSQYTDRLLQTLCRETGIPWAMLDPCASGPQNPPLDYYEKVMESNLKILEEYFDK